MVLESTKHSTPKYRPSKDRSIVRIVRDLLGGKTVTYEGEAFKLKNVKLDFECCRKVPMYIAGRGPLVLQAAGEVGDGAMIGPLASQVTLEYALTQIRKGARRAGRSMDELDIVS
jgi:5,10-methylenetetrahydromethanopterin reductase